MLTASGATFCSFPSSFQAPYARAPSNGRGSRASSRWAGAADAPKQSTRDRTARIAAFHPCSLFAARFHVTNLGPPTGRWRQGYPNWRFGLPYRAVLRRSPAGQRSCSTTLGSRWMRAQPFSMASRASPGIDTPRHPTPAPMRSFGFSHSASPTAPHDTKKFGLLANVKFI